LLLGVCLTPDINVAVFCGWDMETTEGVANFFIQQSVDAGSSDLTQLKLQKMVYFAHGWHLALLDGPLFAEPVQAWRYGPVIQSLRAEFRHFGNTVINKKARDITLDNGILVERDVELRQPATITRFLNRIWEVYGRFSPIQITNMTHEQGTPWHQIATYYNFKIPAGVTIPNDLIKNYFKAIAAK
jgi:uncharacterized phage-associated protein